jgi:hypothetical protein
MRPLAILYKVQRATLGLYAIYAGTVALLTLFVPRVVTKFQVGASLSSTAVVYSQLWAGTRLTVAITALAAAVTPKPPRALVGAIAVGLTASLLGMWFVGAMTTVPWVDLKPFWKWSAIEGLVATILIATAAARAILRRHLARAA